MMKRKVTPLVLLFILVLAFLVAPVAAAGLTVTDGVKINATDGATSPVFTITDADIVRNGTITIDMMYLTYFITSNTVTPDNVIINDTAAAANWTSDVTGTTLTLTSTGGATSVGETVTVTFTGATGNPWVADTMGEQVFPLTATRTDGLGDAAFNFVIETVPPPQKGLTIADGSKITAVHGATSPVITITESPLVQDGTITINVLNLHQYIASFAFTTDNVAINDTAANATWTGTVAGNTLTLTSVGGATAVGETVTVTFTGTVNPWVDNSGGE